MTISFTADEDFTKVEREFIEVAVMKWNFAIHNAVNLSVKFRALKSPAIYKATAGLKKQKANKIEDNPNIWGLAVINSGDIYITYINEQFKDLIIHEIGHILIGTVQHSTDKRSIMYHYLMGGQIIMPADIELIVRRYK